MKQRHIKKWLVIILIFSIGYYLGSLILSDSFNKYSTRVIEGSSNLLVDGEKTFYCDIDGDKKSEEFKYFPLSKNKQAVINRYSNSGRFQNIWNLKGETINNFEFISGDYNKDGGQEIFVFTKENDELFLYGINPLKSNKLIFEKVRICGGIDDELIKIITISAGKVIDMNNDGYGEIIFTVSSRRTAHINRVYYFDIKNNKLSKSENFNLQLVGNPTIADINSDGYPEIFLSTYNSITNINSDTVANNSYSASLVLNSDLKLLFEPILYEKRESVTSTYPYNNNGSYNIIAVSWSLLADEESRIIQLDNKGTTLLRERLMSEIFVPEQNRGSWKEIIQSTQNGKIIAYDKCLKEQVLVNLKRKVNQVSFIDINGDDKPEIIFVLNNALALYNNKIKKSLMINIPGLGTEKVHFSVKKNINKPNNLSIQNGNHQYLIQYTEGVSNYIRYLTYFTAGLFLTIVFHLISKLLLSHFERIKKDEKEIMKLQIELMKNQLDPHFLFNALNSISYSINTNDRKNAYTNLGVFSKLMRESISSMEEFSRSLQDEINYVKHYLYLESFRFKNQFEYYIVVSPNVSLTVTVPKMCLFCFVESALKKGILPKPEGGTIEITIDSTSYGETIISIKDNGLHRNIAIYKSTLSNSMMAAQHIINFYNTKNDQIIDVKYIDLGTEGSPAGSIVEITIPIDFEYYKF